MVREIEFRGYSKEEGRWIYGYYAEIPITVVNGAGERVEEPVSVIFEKNTGEMFEVVSETVGQYAMLKDTNKRKIYEGDIIKWGHIYNEEFPVRIAYVEYGPEITFKALNLECFREFPYGRFIYKNTEDHLEIIGNMYESKHLIVPILNEKREIIKREIARRGLVEYEDESNVVITDSEIERKTEELRGRVDKFFKAIGESVSLYELDLLEEVYNRLYGRRNIRRRAFSELKA